MHGIAERWTGTRLLWPPPFFSVHLSVLLHLSYGPATMHRGQRALRLRLNTGSPSCTISRPDNQGTSIIKPSPHQEVLTHACHRLGFQTLASQPRTARLLQRLMVNHNGTTANLKCILPVPPRKAIKNHTRTGIRADGPLPRLCLNLNLNLKSSMLMLIIINGLETMLIRPHEKVSNHSISLLGSLVLHVSWIFPGFGGFYVVLFTHIHVH